MTINGHAQTLQACFRSFMQRVHPDKFISHSQDAFSQNSKIVQIVNALYKELYAQFGNSNDKKTSIDICTYEKFPVTTSISELHHNINAALPPMFWFIHASKECTDNNSIVNNVSLALTKDALLKKQPNLGFLSFLCKEIFHISKVEDSLLSQFPKLSHSSFVEANKETSPIKHRFSDIFYNYCDEENHKFVQTHLGKIARSPELISFFSDEQYSPCKILKTKNTTITKTHPHKRPVSFTQYQHQCDMAYASLDEFFNSKQGP